MYTYLVNKTRMWEQFEVTVHGKKSSTCCNVVMNRIEQCCAAHIVQGCQQW